MSIGIAELKADIIKGRVKQFTEYGSSISPRPLPSICVVQNDGANDTLEWQIWACFPIGHTDEMNRYCGFDKYSGELFELLARRRDRLGKMIWKHGNHFDSPTVQQEGALNYLRAGIKIILPKLLRNYSADL